MKIIEKLNSGMKKIAKGLFALFTINLLIFGGVLIIQSCQTDNEIFDNNKQELALIEFENSLFETKNTINKISNKNDNFLSKKIEEGNSKKYIENELNSAIKPLINKSKKLLLAYDFSEEEIDSEMDNEDSSNLILTAMFISAAEKDRQGSVEIASFYNYNLLGIQSANAFALQNEENKAVNCFLEATGVTAGIALVAALTDQAIDGAIKAAAKKLFKKAGAKMAGGIFGLAILVGEFTWCMNR